MDRLTKFAHFLPFWVNYSLDRLAKLYIDEIVKLHGILVGIISDCDPQFTSRFWNNLQQAMGIKLNFSTAFYSHLDRQSEKTIQTLEDMLRACVIDLKAS